MNGTKFGSIFMKNEAEAGISSHGNKFSQIILLLTIRDEPNDNDKYIFNYFYISHLTNISWYANLFKWLRVWLRIPRNGLALCLYHS